jgi:hypothetical protein
MASPKAWWLKAATGLHGRGRTRGLGDKAGSTGPRRSRRPHIEELEPRVVLTGLINYIAPPTGSDLTLRVEKVGGAADLQLFNNANSSVIQQVALNQGIRVQIVGADKAGDLLTVDLSDAGGGTAEPIAVKFTGGAPAAGVTDKVTIGGSGAQYRPATFSLQSDSDIFVTGALQATGDLSLTAAQESDGVVTGTGSITADASADITVIGGSLTGHNITLAAQSTIAVNSRRAGLFGGLVRLGTVSSDSAASVEVQGGTLTASGNLSLTATSNVASALTTAPAAPGTTGTDAAIANSTIASTATVTVSGGTLAATGGNATIAATNLVNVTTTADGSAGASASSAKGGTAAVTVLSGDTDATVSGGTVKASGVSVSATDNRTVTTLARATQGGATTGNPGPTRAQQALATSGAATPDSRVNVAGAVAVTKLSGDAAASVIGGTLTSSVLPLTIDASAANHPTTTADGSTAKGGAGAGVGVAVAIGRTSAYSVGSLGGTASVTAPAVNVSSVMPATSNGVTPASQFAVAATSGASTAPVGVAGALAIDVTAAAARAYVEVGANLNLHGADLTLTAQSTTSSTASALPEQVAGASVGTGASVAINTPDVGSRAAVNVGATVAGVHTLTLLAQGTHTATTDAQAGAAGGTAAAGAFSLAAPSGATEAAIGVGATLTLGGGLTMTADRTTTITTRVDGATAAPGVAVGASLALTIANESATAELDRSVNAAAATLIHAEGHGTSDTTALAGTAGAKPGTTPANTLIDDAVNFLTTQGLSSGTAAVPTAATPDGQAGVAGAIAVNLDGLDASALIGRGSALQVTGGPLTVSASVTSNDAALADGTGVNTATGVAGAVAINRSTPTAEALIYGSVKATAVTVTATANGQTGVTANSGRGSTSVGVAGALALDLPGASSHAEIAAGSSAAATGSTAGDVLVQALTTVAQDNATANGKVPSFTRTGVGASVAIDIPTDGATAAASGTVTAPRNVTVSASGIYASTATAVAGATGGTAMAPALALDVSHDTTMALVGSAALIGAGGAMLVSARHRDKSTGFGRGDTAGSDVAVGAALGLDFDLGSDAATIAGTLTRSAVLTVEADMGITDAAQGTSSAKGASSGGTGMDGLMAKVLNYGKSSGFLPATATVPGAATPNGDLAVAAAAAADVDLASQAATIAAGGSVVTSAPLLVFTLSDLDDSATAVGSPTDGSTLGVGAALAIDAARPTILAGIAGTVTAPAISVRTEMGGDGTDTFQATASSGAGIATTGVVGALAINVGAAQSTAAIQDGAKVTIGGGQLLVDAEIVTADLANALAKSANPQLGLGASIATNAALNQGHASIGNAAVTGAGTITVQAEGTHHLTTLSNAGARIPTAAAAAAVSVGFAGDQTVADILPGPAILVIPGTLTIHADDQATIATTADAAAGGSGVGVGAAVAAGVDREVTTADLARGANVKTIVLHADSTTPTTTAAHAGPQGGKDLGQSIGTFVNSAIGLADPDDGGPGQVVLPLVGDTLSAIQAQVGTPMPALSASAAVAVGAVLPQTLAQLGANAALTSATPVTIQTNVTANPTTTADGGATTSAAAAHLSLAANYAGGNNQVAVGGGASISAPSITMTAGGPGAQSLSATASAGTGSPIAAAASVALNAGDPQAPNAVQVTVAGRSHLTATTGDVTLSARSDVTATTLAGGGALGKLAGVGASIAGAFLQEQANVSVAGQIDAPAGNVALTATGHDTLQGAAVAGAVAVGTVAPAVRADVLDKTVQAHIDPGGRVHASKDVSIQAVTSDQPEAVDAGLGLGVATVEAAATAVALNEHTWAFINGATVRADGNVLIGADSTAGYQPLAATGSLGVIGVGVSGTLFYESEDTQANIAGNASVDALALRGADSVPTGTETNGVPDNRSIRGVWIAAINSAAFRPLAGSIGAQGILAVQGSGIATVLNNHVAADITGGAKVNQDDAGSASSQLVGLLAWDETVTAGVQGDLGAATRAGVSATFDYAVLVKDTEAYIGANAVVSSNSNVEVRADSTEDLNAFAGALNLGGQAAAAASGALHVIQARTMAHTDAGARINAPGSVLVLADSSSDDTIIAVAGSSQPVGARVMDSQTDIGGATFSPIKIGSETIGETPGATSAAVDSQVTANTLNVTATSTSTPTAETVLMGSGTLNVGAASPTARASLQTSASLGSGANITVTTLVGPHATSVSTADAFNLHLNAGTLNGVALLPDAEAGGSTRAFVAEGARVTASGLDVQADAANTATVTPINISQGSVAGTYANPRASTSQDVEAYIGPAFGQNATVGLSGTINVGKGTVAVNAESLRNRATVDEVGIQAGGLTLSYMHPQATIAGSTRAHVGGTFGITAGAVDVTGSSTNQATTDVISIDSTAATAVANTQGTTTNHTTEAYVGTGANLTLNDPLTLHATSANTATAGEVNIRGSYVNVQYAKSEADAGGATRAYVQEGASIHATGLSVLADAANTATANSFSATLGNIKVAIAQPTAQTTHVVEAYIGPAAGQAPGGSLSGTIDVGAAPIQVHATSTSNHATAQKIDLAIGGITVGVEQPRVTAGGSTIVHLGGQFAITAGGVDALASAPDNLATGDAVSLAEEVARVNVADRAATTDHTAQAYVGTGANLTITGGSLSLHATSTNTAKSGQVAINVGDVEVRVAKSEANAGGDTSAYVQEGATIRARGLDLSAQSVNTAEANPIDFGVAAVKVDVAHPIAETSHTTEVYIGPPGSADPTPGSSGQIGVGAGSVTGEATSTSTATVDPLDVGASGIDVSVLHPEVTAGGSTSAHLGGSFTIGAGTLKFTASSNNTATSNSVSVEVSGVNVTDNIKSALTDHATSAYVGRESNLTLRGALTLDAESTNTAQAGQSTVNIAGVPVALVQPAANADGSTLAYVGEGATLRAEGLTADATATTTANAGVTMALGGGVSVAVIRPTAATGDDVEAFIGPAAGSAPTPGLSGTISLGAAAALDATSHDSARVNPTDITAGAVAVKAVRPSVTAGGDTLVHLGGNYTINAAAVRLVASAPDTQASTKTFSFDIAALDVGVASSPVTAAHETDAFLAPGANVTVHGPLTFHATSGSTATASSQDIGIGAARIASLGAAALVDGGTRAYAGDGAVLHAGNASFLADSTDNAVASQSSVGASLLGVVKLDLQAINQQAVESYLGAGSNVQATGGLTLSATSTEGASAPADGTQGAIIGLADVSPQATVKGMTTAHVDGTVQAATLSVTATATQDVQADASVLGISVANGGSGEARAQADGQALAKLSGTARLTTTGDATFQATSLPGATASATGGGGGLISGSALKAQSAINDVARAFADTGATVVSAGDLTFSASDTADGGSHASVGSGGAFSDGQTDAESDVEAFLGSNVQVAQITGNLVLQAESVHAEGNADAQAASGGAAALGSSNATVHSNPTVDAYIGTGSDITVGGNVTLAAIAHADPSDPSDTGISASSAAGGSGGLVASSTPTAQTDVSPTVTAYVAASQLNVGGDLAITSDATTQTSAHGDTSVGGVGAGTGVTAATSFQDDSAAFVGVRNGSAIDGGGVQVVVGGLFRLEADSALTGTGVTSHADSGGLYSSANAHSNADFQGTTQAVVGTNASVTAQSVDILADLTAAQGRLASRATASGATGSATADTNGTWDPEVLAQVAPGAALTGTEGVDIRALSASLDVTQDPDGTFHGLGKGHSNQNMTFNPTTRVDGGAGATITAGPRILPGPGVPASYVTPLQQPAGYPLLALYVDASDGSHPASTPTRIGWDSNLVLLSGPSPDLMIDASGQIVRAINVSVNGGQRSGQVSGPITVDPIANNGRGQALFQSSEQNGGSVIATSLASGPLFTFRETFPAVTILDESRYSLTLGDINVVNTATLEPGNQVTLDGNTVSGFQFSVNHDFKPTTIDVTAYDQDFSSTSDIRINGTINNPIGFTNLYNYNGSIYVPDSGPSLLYIPPTGNIITDSFDILASGDVGLDEYGLQLEVVESADGPEAMGIGERSVSAGGSAYVEIHSLYRRNPPGDVPADGYSVAIDRIQAANDVVVVLDSPVIQTTLDPSRYLVQVGETPAVTSPDSPNPMDVVDHFRPNEPGSAPTVFPMGVFGTTSYAYTVPVEYVFGSSGDGSSGILAGSSISLDAWGGDGYIEADGYYHLGYGGKISTRNVANGMTAR